MGPEFSYQMITQVNSPESRLYIYGLAGHRPLEIFILIDPRAISYRPSQQIFRSGNGRVGTPKVTDLWLAFHPGCCLTLFGNACQCTVCVALGSNSVFLPLKKLVRGVRFLPSGPCTLPAISSSIHWEIRVLEYKTSCSVLISVRFAGK